ncbi:MAG: cell envelope integrity EipB family protein [Hyphomicrobiaceae bacterium]|jgi:hypothetical protein
MSKAAAILGLVWGLLGLGALVGAFAGPGGMAAAAADARPITLAPHRAVYDMALDNARSGSGVSNIVGRMVYELTGSACDGFTQNMRFVTVMTNQEGAATTTDLRTSSWEEGNGRRLTFRSNQLRDQKATEATSGDASRQTPGGAVKVELTQPAKKSLALDPQKIYFPVQHSIALLTAARAGKTLFRADLYDGSEKGEKVYDTVTSIGRQRPPGANRALAKVANAEPLDHLSAWPVSIGYFETGKDNEDAVPVYELSFLFYENGVSRNLTVDYGEFSMRGELKEITFLAPSKCAAGSADSARK